MQSGEITLLLREWQVGTPEAFEQLVQTAYPSLRSIAESYLRRERPGHTLQATALVNELYLKLVKQRKPEWKDRAHFFTFAAKLMRMILIDHSRANKARKRGGEAVRVPLTPELPWLEATEEHLLDLEQAMQELEKLDAKKVRMLELRYFLGATAEETAETLGLSKATVDREMKFVRSWLAARLRKGETPA
ncbi:MAG: sigma-70 family RNA polymerase sigma factor [Acidobacteria bacterium]|nr:sigma-70 family RNA polymerase sigma factor [Acidobacteriota bacterium]